MDGLELDVLGDDQSVGDGPNIDALVDSAVSGAGSGSGSGSGAGDKKASLASKKSA